MRWRPRGNGPRIHVRDGSTPGRVPGVPSPHWGRLGWLADWSQNGAGQAVQTVPDIHAVQWGIVRGGPGAYRVSART